MPKKLLISSASRSAGILNKSDYWQVRSDSLVISHVFLRLQGSDYNRVQANQGLIDQAMGKT